ncbi:dephospho-CoA kinase [Pendulispora albinea]|uniref:Dephospho-CoA kinase n=1 Tax=Pendulispora albinea TaxID=2741071 RepID=A0ABZ2M9Q6_9BACT
MILFGLTGGLASGKSAVAARLRAHRLPVIDADALARDVVAPGSSGLAAIVRAFGPEVLTAEGALDRPKVAGIVFSDPEKRRVLNGIVHPRIGALTAERARALEEQGEPLACYEAALLVENGLADAFRPLVVVAATPSLQLARAVARDGESAEQVRLRLAAQMPLEAKVAVADFVIHNTGTLDELNGDTDRVFATICARAGIDGARYGISPNLANATPDPGRPS